MKFQLSNIHKYYGVWLNGQLQLAFITVMEEMLSQFVIFIKLIISISHWSFSGGRVDSSAQT